MRLATIDLALEMSQLCITHV